MQNSSIVISPLVLFCFQGRLIKQFGELITFFANSSASSLRLPLRFYRKFVTQTPEGFTVFNVETDSLNARRKLRTTNMVEFQNKDLKKRTRSIRVSSNKESLLRIATALLIELDEKWLANGKVYLKG